MQEQLLQRAEFFSVVRNRAIAVERADVSLPHQLAGLGDNGHLRAEALHGLEHVRGEEDRAALPGDLVQPLLDGGHTGRIDALERLEIVPSRSSAAMSPCHTSLPGLVIMATCEQRRSTVSSTCVVRKTVERLCSR